MTVYECSGSKTFWNVGAAISKRDEQDFHKFGGNTEYKICKME
jgi:hypothetical protein